MRMNYGRLFESIQPGFFNKAGIKSLPENLVFSELVLELQKDVLKPAPFGCPESISFGEYHGDIEKLKRAVALVDEDWVQYYHEQSRAFCAFDGDAVVSFCILCDWGRHDGVRIGGPGCVGTVPEYRKKGIGLEMVRRATDILKEEGFDLSWIHYTHVGPWYERLGYRTVLQWNCRGIISEFTSAMPNAVK